VKHCSAPKWYSLAKQVERMALEWEIHSGGWMTPSDDEMTA
jgi:hypothetical protein